MRFFNILKRASFFILLSFFLSMVSTTPAIASDIEIKIGAAFDITGPYADEGMVRAYQDYVKWINDQGGLKDLKGQSVRIRLFWQDAQSNIPKGLAAYKDFKSKGCVLQFFSSTGQNYALKKRAMQDKIPLVSQLVTGAVFEGEASWVYSQSGFRENIVAMQDGIKAIWKKSRPPVVGFMGWDNLIGQDQVPFGIAYAKELGFVVGPDVYFSPKALDVSPQIRKLHDAKCDFVLLAMAGGQQAMVEKNKYTLGFNDMKFISYPPSTTMSWAAIKKLEPKIYNGNMMWNTFCLASDDAPIVKMIVDMQKKYHKGEVMWDEWGDYAWGLHTAYVTVAALKKALQKVPADKLTGADLKKYGIDTLKIDTQGLSMGASYVDYPGDRQATIGGRLCEQRDGKLVPLTDWIPNVYQPAHSPTAPKWIKETAKEMAAKRAKKKK